MDTQQAKTQGWCLANDIEIGGVFIDAVLSEKSADNWTVWAKRRIEPFIICFCLPEGLK